MSTSRIYSGCTAGEVELHRDSKSGVFVLDFVGEEGAPRRLTSPYEHA